MWGEKAASPVHAIHTFHSVGVLVAVPFTGAFLSNRNETGTAPHDAISLPYILDINNVSVSNNNQTRVQIPYGVAGGVGILASMTFVIFHIIGWTFIRLVKLESASIQQIDESRENNFSGTDTQESVNREIKSQKEVTKAVQPDPSCCMKWTFLIGLFVSYTALMYRDAVLSTYLFPITVKSKLKMTKQEATYLTTGYSAAYAGGRIASIIYSKYINIHILVFLEAALVIVGSILLTFLGLEGRLQMWVITCFIGICSSPTYPSVMSWANFYIPVTGLVVAAIDIGIGAGAFSGTWVGGYIFDHLGPLYIFYVSVAFSVILLVILTMMQIFGYIGKKNQNAISNIQSDTCDERTPLIN